jgi:cell division protein FtsA
MVNPEEVIRLPSTQAQGDRQIPRELLAHIIHQRMDEIFDMVQREIANAGYQAKLPAGLVLSGGAAEVEGIAELAQDVFGAGVRVGSPTNLAGLSDSVEAPRFATVVGLAQYGAGRMAAGGGMVGGRRAQLGGAGVDRIATRVKTWLQDFF